MDGQTDGKMDRQMDGGVSVWTYRQSQERLTSRLTEDSKSAEWTNSQMGKKVELSVLCYIFDGSRYREVDWFTGLVLVYNNDWIEWKNEKTAWGQKDGWTDRQTYGQKHSCMKLLIQNLSDKV